MLKQEHSKGKKNENGIRKMRLLVSAYACEPHKGSEPGVGWNFVKELSKRHSITVLTRANNRDSVMMSGEDWIGNIDWQFLDPPQWLTFWKRGGFGVQLFYVIWQWYAYKKTKLLLESCKFDLIHHITFGKYWVPSFLGLTGIPLVFGPVGGGESLPKGYFTTLSFRGKVSEIAKAVSSWVIPRLPFFRKAYRNMTYVLSATQQTDEKVKKLVSCKTEVFPQSGISNDELVLMEQIVSARKLADFPLFVTACRLNHWKAIELAIRAFALVSAKLPEARLEILGNGPELYRLIKLAKSLGLNDNVAFLGKLPTLDDVYEKIASATALIHPALHEAFGQACLEALALETPVVCWDWGGPGLIVDDTCGKAISFGLTIEKDLAEIADAMLAIASSYEIRTTKGINGRKRVENHFTWCHLIDRMIAIYDLCVGRV